MTLQERLGATLIADPTTDEVRIVFAHDRGDDHAAVLHALELLDLAAQGERFVEASRHGTRALAESTADRTRRIQASAERYRRLRGDEGLIAGLARVHDCSEKTIRRHLQKNLT